MYYVGDTVLYASQGVCKIIGTDEKKFNGNKVEYFILQPVYDKNSKIFVPSSNEKLLSKMRPIISADEVRRIIKDIPNEDTIWISDDGKRKQEYQQIIVDGDREKLLQLIKTLRLHESSQQLKGRHLHQSDDYLLKQAEKLLYDEFAIALNIEPDEVSNIVAESLRS